MELRNLEELFVDKLKDVYDAERRITKALPKMAKKASSEELTTAFEEHLEQTQEQIARLDRIFESLGISPGRKTCHAMMGLLEEGQEAMEKDTPEPVMDAALICAAQSVEHYEMAGYGCLRTWAELLDKGEEAKLLKQTLEEEERADETLTRIARKINEQALEGVRATELDEDADMVGARVGNGPRSSKKSRSR